MSAALRTVVLAGTVAGVLDLGYVIVLVAIKAPAVSVTRLLQNIAAGALGPDAAARGGVGTAVLGLAFHFTIALGAAAVFYTASRRLRVLVKQPVLSGACFGLAVWLFMNLVVLPLSATPPKSFPSPLWGWILAAHVLCVGIPIALVVRRCEPQAPLSA